jgi:hypothetical protein
MAFPLRLPSLATWKKPLMLRSQELQQKSGLTLVVVAKVLMMLRWDERRCDFGVSLPHHVIYSYFIVFVNFGCHAQASQLFEPVQASSPRLIATMPKADVVDLSSSDTDALLDSLFVSPACDSPIFCPRTGSDGDSFENSPRG